MDWGPIAATLLGVIVGGGLTELTESLRRRRFRKAFAAALICEIESLRDRYMEVIGKTIEAVPPGDFLKGSAVLEENYFTVFESSAHQIGYLEPEHARQVLSFYVTAKGQIDTLRTWHTFVGDLNIGRALKKEYFERIRNDQTRLLEAADRVSASLRSY